MKPMHRWLILPAAMLLLLTPPLPADVIVFDPTNLAVNLEQVAHHLEVIARIDRQIRNQLRMLEHWRFTRLEQLLASIGRVRGTLDGVANLDLTGLYPAVPDAYAHRDADSMQKLRRQWLESHRAAVVQARTTQNQVVAEMADTQSRLQEYLERSRQAPGQTAVLQASNETIATLAAQLQNLQALELTETRVELEEEARRQSEATFHRQRCETLMHDWDAPDSHVLAAKGLTQHPFANR